MPHFYFTVQTVDGTVEVDTIGADFESEDQAINHARQFASDAMRNAAASKRDTVQHVLEVSDVTGVVLYRVEYRAIV